jgi:short-subunit dehydrogenase
MKSVVVTGGTRGIGYGLADSFLSRGCAVAICGRNPDNLSAAMTNLTNKYPSNKIVGYLSDLRDFSEVQAFWDKAKEQFGQIDIWINNAGITHPRLPLWEQTPETLEAVVETNLLASLYGSKVAIQGMLKQGFGTLYNMEGSGSGGMKVKNLTLYGTTKYAIRFLTESLVLETKGTPIIVGAISPGIVVTDLLTGQYDDEKNPMPTATKRLLNVLADRVETVAPYLVEQILANQKTGVRLAWLTKGKALRRLLFSPFSKRDLFN